MPVLLKHISTTPYHDFKDLIWSLYTASKLTKGKKIQSLCVCFGIMHLNWTEDDKETYHANNGEAGAALSVHLFLLIIVNTF